MKNLKSFILLFTAILTLSCSSDDDNESDNPTAGDGQISAQVDGSAFTSTSITTSASLSSNVLQLIGVNTNGDSITISIADFEGVGSFDTSGLTLEATAIYLPSGDTTFFNTSNEGGEGTITISEFSDDDIISGSFMFTATRPSTSESVSITNGSFSDISVTRF